MQLRPYARRLTRKAPFQQRIYPERRACFEHTRRNGRRVSIRQILGIDKGHVSGPSAPSGIGQLDYLGTRIGITRQESRDPTSYPSAAATNAPSSFVM